MIKGHLLCFTFHINFLILNLFMIIFSGSMILKKKQLGAKDEFKTLGLFQAELTLAMLRLLASKAQGHTKPSKLCHVTLVFIG